MIKLGDYIVTPTIFPDGSSQIWQLPEAVLNKESIVTWEFQNEAELSHVLQLSALVAITRGFQPSLYMPYLVYGRQDKEISNDKTFAKNVIVGVLSKFFYKITTLDAHSNCKQIESIQPKLSDLFLKVKPDMICFPDKGASFRGYNTSHYPVITLDKIRNQTTGEIEGLKLIQTNIELNNKTILIVDDLIDAGRTFIEAAKLLKSLGAKSVCLYTTHGIYSKGTQVLFNSGIDRVFNYKGEVKNGN